MSAKREKPPSPDMSFSEALERLSKTKPGEIAEIITRDIVKAMKRTEKRIEEAREEINRGARTRRKRFRL
jgi:hypothetical protein